MSSNLPAHPDADRFKRQHEVMDLYVKSTPIRVIAAELGITQKEVRVNIDEWKKTAVGGEFLKDRVTELIAVMDEHYTKLIEEVWNTIADINAAIEMATQKEITGLLGQRISALKTAGELDTKRVDMMQKAGLLEAADLGDEMAEVEAKQEQIMDLLKHVTKTCPNCRMEVARRLSAIKGEAVSVEDPDAVDGEVVE